MEIVIDFLMEVILEVFVEGLISLWFWIFPNRKLSEKGKLFIKIICAAISLAFLVALVAGIILLGGSHGNSFLGWVLISLSALYIISGIVLKMFFYIENKYK